MSTNPENDIFAAVRDVQVAPLDDPGGVVRRGKRRRSARLVARSGLVVGALVGVVALAGPVLQTRQMEPIAPAGLTPSIPEAEAIHNFQGVSPYEEELLEQGVTRAKLRDSAQAVIACTEHHGYGSGGTAVYDIVTRSYIHHVGPFAEEAPLIGQGLGDCLAWFHDDIAEAWLEQLAPWTAQQEQQLQDEIITCLERESGISYGGPTGLHDIQEHVVTQGGEREEGEAPGPMLDAYEACTQEP